MIDKTGAIYDGDNNYYGEYIEYCETFVSDNDITNIKCKVKSSLSLDRIIKLIQSKNPEAKIDIKYEDDGIFINFNENDYDIFKLRRWISLFDGIIGKYAILEFVL